jgi:2-oxoglutarate ferredoxin oxidoreductase subunit beta
MDGPALVETLTKALQNNGFSLVHVIFPCTTNFANTALGSRNAVNIFRWIRDHAAPLGQQKEDTFWRTGVYHDVSNSRPEFSELVWGKITEIQRRHDDERPH